VGAGWDPSVPLVEGMPNVNPHRVAVLDDGSLLIAAAMRLLVPGDELEIRLIDESAGDPTEALRGFGPDVIVVPQMQANGSGTVPLERLLHVCPQARVVVLSPDQPTFEVYREVGLESATVEGFLAAVTGMPA
jgi:hypothetical protein